MGARTKKSTEQRLLEFLGSPRYQPLNKTDLAKRLKIPVDERSGLRRLLSDLETRGQITRIRKDRYVLPKEADLMVVLKMIKDEKEAEDVLQEGFIYIWRKAAAYNPQLNSPFGWAVMILRNKAIDRIRSRRRVERIIERVTVEFSHFADADERSADEPVFGEQRAIVRAGLAHIPEEQRQAIELAFFSGLTHEEIAAHLALPLGTIKARIRRGLIRMRDLVKGTR